MNSEGFFISLCPICRDVFDETNPITRTSDDPLLPIGHPDRTQCKRKHSYPEMRRWADKTAQQPFPRLYFA